MSKNIHESSQKNEHVYRRQVRPLPLDLKWKHFILSSLELNPADCGKVAETEVKKSSAAEILLTSSLNGLIDS